MQATERQISSDSQRRADESDSCPRLRGVAEFAASGDLAAEAEMLDRLLGAEIAALFRKR